jgi:hypothetical protein
MFKPLSYFKCIYVLLIGLVFTFLNMESYAQATFYHIRNEAVYEFLDEMANEQIIRLNTTIKPYSHKTIISKLEEADTNRYMLSKRQEAQLDFYKRQFVLYSDTAANPYSGDWVNIFNDSSKSSTSLQQLSYSYKDSLNAVRIKPIWGVRHYSNENGFLRHYWGGLKATAHLGNNLGIYASWRDNNMTSVMARPGNLVRYEGGNYKGNEYGGGDYSEMRGGITYSWKNGYIGIVKDHLEWGDNYHGANIFSGRAPSFTMLKLHLNPVKWFELNYFHGWLVSEVIDSSRTYITSKGDERKVFRDKYIAANMFTVIPWQGVNFSFGNSIVYSDMDVHPAYLLPFMFYKSIDHTLNHAIDNQNSQIYFNISIRKLKHFHIYGSLFIDEFSIDRVGDPDVHNFWSEKAGLKISNLPVDNIGLTFEYTKTSPITFKHRLPANTFATNKYNLGHYLIDDAADLYMAITYKPLANLKILAAYNHAIKGHDYVYEFVKPFVDSYNFVEDISWEKNAISLSARYQYFSEMFVFAEYRYQDIETYKVDGKSANHYMNLYTPEIFHGLTHTVTLGFNIGF